MALDNMKGSHGTCVSRAEEIKKKSFSPSLGIKGDGVYFWAYSSNESLAKALVIGWWEKCNKDKVYAKESNTDCAVLGVSLVVEEAYCLIKVVKVKVPPPKKLNYPLSIAYLGSPLCYVVKDVDCIKNVRSMEVENE